jgi:hypothetical protein
MTNKEMVDAINKSINDMIKDIANKSSNPRFIKNVGLAIMKTALDELNYHNGKEFATALGEWTVCALDDLRKICDTYGKESVN